MSTKNFYSQFPEIPYQKTSVDLAKVVEYANTLVGKYPKEVVRTAYCMFRNESANGKLGVNNNYAGIQADNAEWEGLDLTNVIGTSVKKDNFGDVRRFICFNEDGYKTGFDFVCYKVKQRNMYIGAPLIETPIQVAFSYQKKWVGLPTSKIKSDSEDTKNFISLYKSSIKAIP